MGLRARLLLLILVSVIPALVLALYTNLEQRRFGMFRVEKDAIRVVQLAAANQLGLIEATRQHLGALARLPPTRGTNLAVFDAFFANMPKIYTDYNDFGLIETNGNLVASAFGRTGLTNLATHAHFQRVLYTKDFTIGSYQAGDGTRKPSLLFGHPVFDESGRLARILYAALDLAVLNGVTAKTKLPEGGVVTIFDREGYVLGCHPEPEKWVGKAFPGSPLVRTILSRKEGTIETPGLDGVPRLNAFTAIRNGQDANLFVSVGVPTSLAFAEIKHILVRNLTVLGVVAVLALIAAWAYADSYVVRPVKALASTTKRVAAGDLSARTGITRASGELNQLVRAFDEMTGSLQQQRAQTERSEKAVRESEERVRLVLDTALDAVITIDDEGKITSWNKEAEKMFGWTHQEIVGQRLSDTIIPPGYRAAHERGLKHFLATEEGPVLNKRIEITALHREGREFPVELAITPIRLANHFIFSAFIEDITERKAAKESLARERNLLRLLIDNLPACIYVKDPEGRFLVFNAASVRLVGAASETAALGKTVFDFFPPEIARLYDADDRRLLASGQPVLDREEPTQDRDGNRRWFLTTKLPLRDSRGVTIGLLGISQDITERKQAEEEIRRLNASLEQRVQERTAQLEAVNKELEAFSYSVSHDLRAPLRHVDGFVDILQQDSSSALSESGRRYLEVISRSARQMGALIDDLLAFSRMGRADMRRTRVNMDELVAEVLREMARDTQGRNIEWKIGPLPEVSVDRAMLKQVWVNLLSNALKYTRHRDRAEIEISCSEHNPHEFEFSVRDNGAGFDMQYAGKLFGVFQRLHQPEEFEGTGIGLANVQRIIIRHGGRVRAEGKVNEGAIFYFTLPNSAKG